MSYSLSLFIRRHISLTPATVSIISSQGASGSGVIVNKDGLILTAAHVIQGAKEVIIIFPDGKQAAAKVLGANYNKDSGMCMLEGDAEWPFVSMGDSKKSSPGDFVIAIGHATGYDAVRRPPVRFGRILAKRAGFITTDCTLIGGDSGGPLFNMSGELIGIHSHIGQSLSSNTHTGLSGFIDDWNRMLKGEEWGELNLSPLSNPEAPVMGVDLVNSNSRGALVADSRQASPAFKAGIRKGDLIVKLDDKKIGKVHDLIGAMLKYDVGETVQVSVIRNGALRTYKVKLIKRGLVIE